MQFQAVQSTSVSTQPMQPMVAIQQQPYQQQQQQQEEQPQEANGIRIGFAHKTARGFGICQILCGVLVIIFASVAIHLENILADGGTGIWCGILFIVTGVIGVISSYQKTTGIIVASMIMSIISAAISGAVLFIISSIACGAEPYDYYYRDCYYGSHGRCEVRVETRQTIDGMMILFALLETIIATINSAFCCRAVCCCRKKKMLPVMYYMAAPQGGAPQQVAMAPGMVQSTTSTVFMLPPGVQLVSSAQGPQMYATQPQFQAVAMPPPQPQQQQQFTGYAASASSPPPDYTSTVDMQQATGERNVTLHNTRQDETKVPLAEPQA